LFSFGVKGILFQFMQYVIFARAIYMLADIGK
jgi:hypothetical protein